MYGTRRVRPHTQSNKVSLMTSLSYLHRADEVTCYPGMTSCSYLHRADEVAHAVAHRRVDGVLGDVAAHAVVVVVAFLVAQAPAEALHLVGRLPRAADHLPDAAHRLQPSTSPEYVYAYVTRLCVT